MNASRISSWLTKPWLAPALFGALLASSAANLQGWLAAGRGSPTLAQLGLTEQQVRDAQACCRGCCGERNALDGEIAAKEAELTGLLAAEPLDRAAVEACAQQLGALHARAVENSVQAILLVRGVLTPDQLARLRACCAPETR
jgi:Spy/CpxP family protein refolding chaperone